MPQKTFENTAASLTRISTLARGRIDRQEREEAKKYERNVRKECALFMRDILSKARAASREGLFATDKIGLYYYKDEVKRDAIRRAISRLRTKHKLMVQESIFPYGGRFEIVVSWPEK